MIDSVLSHQLSLAVVGVYVLEWLKKTSAIPMINENSDVLNKFLSVVMAFASITGIQVAAHGSFWDGSTLSFTVPPASVLLDGVFHFVSQIGLQHGFYHLVKKGRKQDEEISFDSGSNVGARSMRVAAGDANNGG